LSEPGAGYRRDAAAADCRGRGDVISFEWPIFDRNRRLRALAVELVEAPIWKLCVAGGAIILPNMLT